MKTGQGGGGLRRQARELMERAAEAGFSGAWRLTALSPREMELEIAAFSARRSREAEISDLSAWLTGKYVLSALHAPRRYPRRPDGVIHRPHRMTEDEMKSVFAALAAQRRENGRN